MEAIPGKDLEIFIHMSELLEVVNVVLVGFDVETEVHASELVELAHVHVVAEVVTSQVCFFFAVLLDSLEELIELLLSFEDIDLFRFDFFGLSFLKILSSLAGSMFA